MRGSVRTSGLAAADAGAGGFALKWDFRGAAAFV